MITPRWTFSRTLTFRQFIFCIFTHIISITLPFMTWFTKMSISPTKPLSNITTKFTFKFNEIFSMFFAILYWNLTTIWTNQFFRIIISLIICLIHCISTIFSSTKKWILTFETLKIGINCHTIFIWFIIIR